MAAGDLQDWTVGDGEAPGTPLLGFSVVPEPLRERRHVEERPVELLPALSDAVETSPHLFDRLEHAVRDLDARERARRELAGVLGRNG